MKKYGIKTRHILLRIIYIVLLHHGFSSKLSSRYVKEVFINSVNKLEERTLRALKNPVTVLRLEFRYIFYDFYHYY